MTLRWMLGLVLLIASGCEKAASDKTPASDAVPPQQDSAGAATDQPVDAREVSLDVKSWDEVQAWVGEQKGKLVVLDVWSTSCPPCVAELPKFVALHRQHGDEVVCATLSVDYTGSDKAPPADLQEEVLAVLKKLSATTTNFLASDKDEEVTAKIGVAAIPVALVYDREGKLLKQFSNDAGEYGKDGYTYEQHIVPLVNGILQTN